VKRRGKGICIYIAKIRKNFVAMKVFSVLRVVVVTGSYTW
jgi:hypothetical protein